jgi:hypothetical protein
MNKIALFPPRKYGAARFQANGPKARLTFSRCGLNRVFLGPSDGSSGKQTALLVRFFVSETRRRFCDSWREMNFARLEDLNGAHHV